VQTKPAGQVADDEEAAELSPLDDDAVLLDAGPLPPDEGAPLDVAVPLVAEDVVWADDDAPLVEEDRPLPAVWPHAARTRRARASA
jgi:hypothetical protein